MSRFAHSKNSKGNQNSGRALPVLRAQKSRFNSTANRTIEQTTGAGGKLGMAYCAAADSNTAGQKFRREPRASTNVTTAIATLNTINNTGRARRPISL